MNAWRAPLVVLIVGVLGGCAAGASDPAGPGVTVPSGTTDCGTYVLTQRGDPQHPGDDRVPDSALSCFLDAVRAKSPAVLTVSLPTVEGDPIHYTYLSDVQGSVQVTEDTREDRYGPRAIYHMTCTGPSADNGRLSFVQCSTPVAA